MKKVTAIIATVAFLASVNVANAYYYHRSSDDNIVNINTTNSANITNSVTTKANTGSNYTTGGDAGNSVSGYGNNGNNDANGGDADVETGDAIAVSSILNNVNGTDVRVTGPDCGCKGDNTVNVNTKNTATVSNSVYTKANTGYNVTKGGDAGNDVNGATRLWWKKHWNKVGNNGGNEANGGDADVETGDATSATEISNYVNQTIVRVSR